MSKMRVFGYTAHCPAAAEALGQPRHVSQVKAYVAAPSRIAAARAFMAARVLHAPSEAAASREIGTYGGEVADMPVVSATPGHVFVAPLNGWNVEPTPWPAG